jgi:hypothetical protein
LFVAVIIFFVLKEADCPFPKAEKVCVLPKGKVSGKILPEGWRFSSEPRSGSTLLWQKTRNTFAFGIGQYA